MLPMSNDREWLLRRAAEEDESCVSVGGLYVRIAREEAKRKAAARAAFAKLIELQRRNLLLTPEELALRAGVEVIELVRIARGENSVVQAETVRRLAHALSLPEERLLLLAGHGEPTDAEIEEAARFAARSEPVEPLTTQEHKALQGFVRFLAER